MQRKTDSRKAACMPFAEGATGERRRKTDDLHTHVEANKVELLELSKDSVPNTHSHSCVDATIQTARLLRDQCKDARSHLEAATEYYARLKSNWSEIQKRQEVLEDLKSTLLHVQRIHSVAQTVDEAMRKRNFGHMSKSCVMFESLNATTPRRMEEKFTCLHSVSDRVAHAVAESMRILRTDLRNSCRKFDATGYKKCMMDFNVLGASSHFAARVLQVFEEEATRIFDDALALEANAAQKAISFFSMIRGLLAQFTSIIRFHKQPLHHDEDSIQYVQLHRLIGIQYYLSTPPFRHFCALSARVICELKFGLLAEQTTTLLHVFDAAKSFCQMIISGNAMLRRDEQGGQSIHPQDITNSSAATARRGDHPEFIRLRRGGSQLNLHGGQKWLQRRTSNRHARTSGLEQPLSKALRALALDCLSVRHVRHAEELTMIAKSPEAWIRIQLTERNVRALFRDLLHGVDGRISEISRDYVERERSSGDHGEGMLFGQISPATMTFTTPSLAMMRWVSEYATIGLTIPGVLSDALSNITDIFLSLVYSSIDMKSRIQMSESQPFLKVVEDLLLEGPKDKTIFDFIAPASRKSFRTFLDRYGSREPSASGGVCQDQRWGSCRRTRLNRYTNAVGLLSLNTRVCHESIVRECVAAEGIGTFCEVMSCFSAYIEDKIRHNAIISEHYGPLQMASLVSAVAVGKEVQKAFYGLLAWDIIGGWEALSAIAETCRSSRKQNETEREEATREPSLYVTEMLSRIRTAYSDVALPPAAAERISVVICETVMGAVLEGFSKARLCSHAAAASQMLLDIRALELALVQHTGLYPCPGRVRTEMYIKATYLDQTELTEWTDRHRRKLNLSDALVKALLMGSTCD